MLCSAVYKNVLINLFGIFFQCSDSFWINSCSYLSIVFHLWFSIQLLSTLDKKIIVTTADFMRFQSFLYKSPITEAFICEKRSKAIVSAQSVEVKHIISQLWIHQPLCLYCLGGVCRGFSWQFSVWETVLCYGSYSEPSVWFTVQSVTWHAKLETYDTLSILGTENLSVGMFLQYTSLYQLKWGIFVPE
jgi:hypothetical protein